jgi:hypothetical protein
MYLDYCVTHLPGLYRGSSNVALQPTSAVWSRWVARLASCYAGRVVSRIFS